MNTFQIADWLEKRKTLSYGKTALKAVSKLPQAIKDNTIILIGPMGTGKSSTAKVLRDVRHMDRVSLDNKDRFKKIYEKKPKFRYFKNFEFVLTCSVLASLKEPQIIDFGAGHSVYEDKEVFALMKQICSQFKHVFLLLPTRNGTNPDGSIDASKNAQILSKRVQNDKHRPWESSQHFRRRMEDNNHFLTCHCNYELATKIIYQDDKDPEQVAILIDDEMNKVNKEKGERNEK